MARAAVESASVGFFPVTAVSLFSLQEGRWREEVHGYGSLRKKLPLVICILTALRNQYQLPHRSPRFHQPVRFGSSRQREAFADQ